eukprot:1214801-Amphidinium_carterae.1
MMLEGYKKSHSLLDRWRMEFAHYLSPTMLRHTFSLDERLRALELVLFTSERTTNLASLNVPDNAHGHKEK